MERKKTHVHHADGHGERPAIQCYHSSKISMNIYGERSLWHYVGHRNTSPSAPDYSSQTMWPSSHLSHGVMSTLWRVSTERPLLPSLIAQNDELLVRCWSWRLLEKGVLERFLSGWPLHRVKIDEGT